MCRASSINKEASTRDYTNIENVIKEKIELMHETNFDTGWVAVLVLRIILTGKPAGRRFRVFVPVSKA
jgi:hypothetical protein